MERRTEFAGRVSETTRYIGFGLLAIFYAMIHGTEPFFFQMRSTWPLALRLMALCGAVTILVDYLHYVFSYIAADRALDRKDKPNLYDPEWIAYRLATYFFWAKQVAALAGCGLLIFLVAQAVG
jgi:hypothetical protein